MNFKPTLFKITIALFSIFIWYYFFLSVNIVCQCGCDNPPSCSDVFVFNLIPLDEPCDECCSCPSATPFSKIIIDLLIILAPGIIIYIIWSLIQKKK